MPDIETFADADALAAAVAEGAAGVLERVQRERDRVVLALTAGSIMEKAWSSLASVAAESVRWDRVDVIWGDERFVPSDSSDRNDVAAERLLFAHEPFSRAHRMSMPAAEGDDGLDAAALAYADVIDGMHIDLVLLGVGPDGHCCSLFPHHPGLEAHQPIVPVRNSPKPPPERLSFSFDTLNGADEIWVVASGDGKADALAAALRDGDRTATPIAGAQGRIRTRWLLDRAAASGLPS